MGLFGKQTRTIIIDEQGNIVDGTFDEHTNRQIVESLDALSQARIEVKEAMAKVREESAKNKSNLSQRLAAALVGISDDLSEAYDNLRGARSIEDAAYATAEARAGYQRWEELRVETGADVSDYQGPAPSWDGYSGE